MSGELKPMSENKPTWLRSAEGRTWMVSIGYEGEGTVDEAAFDKCCELLYGDDDVYAGASMGDPGKFDFMVPVEHVSPIGAMHVGLAKIRSAVQDAGLSAFPFKSDGFTINNILVEPVAESSEDDES